MNHANYSFLQKQWFRYFFLLLLLGCTDRDTDQKVLVSTGTDSPAIKQPAINPYSAVDISPLDISYFPADYPILKMSDKGAPPLQVRIIYSRPHRQGRKVFGSLLNYGEPWRLGANEATEIEFFEPAVIQNKTVNKGRYVLYCIPEADHWTIVFNTNLYSWGLKPEPEKDVHRFQIPVQQSDTSVEYFTMVFEKTTTGTDLIMTWEDVLLRLPIQFN